jgi:alpha/beta superfamily hydrolase
VLLFPDVDIDIRQVEINKNHYFQNGFDVLITAYRGTANSVGELKREADLFYDAQHWYNFAKSQFSENEIILVGDRFGATIAAQLAGNNSAKTLILENPYYSYSDYKAHSRFWWLPYSYFTSYKLNTWEYIRKTSTEIVLIQDENKKIQSDSLTSFLKSGDKTYWLKNNEDIPFSFQSNKSSFFNEIISHF